MKFNLLMAALVMALGVLVLLSLSARAQDVRGPNGNLLYRYSQEGNHVVRRDPNGRMLDYSERSGNSIETRDPNGRLLTRENLPHH